MALNHSSVRRRRQRRQRHRRQRRQEQQEQQQQHLSNDIDDVDVDNRRQEQHQYLNNGNDDDVDVDNNNGVRPRVIDTMSKWREDPSEYRSLYFWGDINQLEAIFVVDKLRRELPIEGCGNNPKKTTLQLAGDDFPADGLLDEAIDVFCDFLQETPCHLVSLTLEDIPHQQLRRLLQALHPNTSVNELTFRDLRENDGALIEELLRHKTDFTKLSFRECHFSISNALTGHLAGLTHLKILELFYCHVDDEAVRVILQHRYPFITDLNLNCNQITSNGLGILARRIPEALPNLEMLQLYSNPDLLNHPENTRLFANNVLPMLKELDISDCGEEASGYIQIIKACEAENVTNKLEFLDVDFPLVSQAIRNQLVESLPKMKVKRLYCNCLPNDDQALLSALYKNTSIITLHSFCGSINDETRRRHVAPIMQRNKLLTNIQKHLLNGTIITPLGRWSRVLAEVGHERVRHGATPVYMILQAALAQWVIPMPQDVCNTATGSKSNVEDRKTVRFETNVGATRSYKDALLRVKV